MLRMELVWAKLHIADKITCKHQCQLDSKNCLERGFSNSPCFRAQELCGSGGGRPGLPIPDSPYGLCGRKATLTLNSKLLCFGFDPPL